MIVMICDDYILHHSILYYIILFYITSFYFVLILLTSFYFWKMFSSQWPGREPSRTIQDVGQQPLTLFILYVIHGQSFMGNDALPSHDQSINVSTLNGFIKLTINIYKKVVNLYNCLSLFLLSSICTHVAIV